MMFSMGRDRRMPLGSLWGTVNTTFKTPANAAVAVGVLAAIPFLITGPPGAHRRSARPGSSTCRYFLCNLGVLVARLRGWPREKAWFNLGGGARIVNILALVWGGVMIINFALWSDPALFGDFGERPARPDEPVVDRLHVGSASRSRWLPAIAALRRHRAAVLVAGVVYYAVAVRGRADRVEADPATGEAVIG